MYKSSFFNYSSAWFQLGPTLLSPSLRQIREEVNTLKAIKALSQESLCAAADLSPINLSIFLPFIPDAKYPWCPNPFSHLLRVLSPSWRNHFFGHNHNSSCLSWIIWKIKHTQCFLVTHDSFFRRKYLEYNINRHRSQSLTLPLTCWHICKHLMLLHTLHIYFLITAYKFGL